MPLPTRATRSPAGIVDQLGVLWQRKFTILLIVAIAVAVTLAVDLRRSPQYRSQATLLFLAQGTTGTTAPAVLTPTALATDTQLVESAPVKAIVTKKLGVPAPAATVALVPSTSLATVIVSSADPEFAAKAANAYVNAYVTYSRDAFVEGQLATQNAIQDQINTLQNQIDTVQTQINNTSSKDTSALGTLQTQLSGLIGQQASLKTQLASLQLVTSQSSAGGQMVTPAKVPTSPFSPQKTRDILIAVIVGLVVAIGFVLARDYLDDRIRTKADLDQASGGIPVLGLIPTISDWKDRKLPLVVAASRPKSPPAEAYRGLRTSIQFIGLDNQIRTLQVTSEAAADGKTTTSANLAVAMAQAGREVVLIGCDLRRPRIHEFFGLSNDVGLTSVLVGDANLAQALVRVPGIDHLTLLPSGPIPPNPSELLGSNRTSEVFAVLSREVDLVIVDSPPVLPVTDAAVLAGKVDAVLLVIAAGVTTTRELNRSLESLGRVDAPVAGLVLNRAPESDSYAYYRYGYQYGYGGEYGSAPSNGSPAVTQTNGNGNRSYPSAATPQGRRATRSTSTPQS